MAEIKYFWPQLYKDTEDGKVLIGSRCKECGEVTFPPNDLCVFCCGKKMEEIEFPKTGILYTYTVTRRPVEKWPADHGICQITFPDAKARIIGPLHMKSSDADVRIGEEMSLIFEKYWDEGDDEVYGYSFCPTRLLNREARDDT